MRRKVRIVSTFISLALVLAVMCVGIWATATATINGGTGELSLNPTDVNATVTFADKSTDSTASDVADRKAVSFGTDEFVFEQGTADAAQTVNFTFTQANRTTDKWVFTVTVKNDFASGTGGIVINSKLTASINDTKFTVAISDGTNTVNSEAVKEIAAGSTLTYKITIEIDDTASNAAATGTLSFALELTRA